MPGKCCFFYLVLFNFLVQCCAYIFFFHLDFEQGLHPSFREMRKSLARELTSLQDKLDFIMAKKSQRQMEELAARKPGGDAPLDALNGEHKQEQPGEEVAEPGKEDSSGGIVCETHDVPELQDQLSMMEGNLSLLVDDGKCESCSSVDPVVNEDMESLPSGMVNEDVNHVSADVVSESGVSETEIARQNETKSALEDIPVEGDVLDMNAWKELPLLMKKSLLMILGRINRIKQQTKRYIFLKRLPCLWIDILQP